MVGEDRQQEQRLMSMLVVFSGLLLLLGATLDGPNVSHEQFASEILLAAADLFGVLVGAAVAVLVFALVLAVYESQQPGASSFGSANIRAVISGGLGHCQQHRRGEEAE